ncbi:MAG: molybdate ABC transporter substrate-binding protein [Deinococcales bacterium]
MDLLAQYRLRAWMFLQARANEAFSQLATGVDTAFDHEVRLNFAGSSTLSTQLLQGAYADIFASADEVQMEKLKADNLIENSRTFAHNRLVLISPKDSHLERLEDLSQQGIKLILAAPEVPAGRYARELFNNLNELYGEDFSANVLQNLVSEEGNVRQVAAKIELGEGDAAIVYATDAAILKAVKVIELPSELSPVASYPIALLTISRHPELAQSFIDFIFSAKGQEILLDYGFSLP